MSAATTYASVEEWRAEAIRRFGEDERQWRFVCPCCGHVACAADYKRAGAPSGAVGFSCVGRWLPERRAAFGEGPGPCDYAGGGFFQLNPVVINGVKHCMFAFADAAEAERGNGDG